jgi:hypothetical protein
LIFRVVDRLAATGLDDALERLRLVGVIEAEELRGTEDLAALEGGDLEPLRPFCATSFRSS